MQIITSSWQRISSWYATNTPIGTLILAPGATEEELVHFENEIGFRLPEDLRASFAQHNGTLNEGYLLHHGELLSLQQILHLRGQYLQWQKDENWGIGPDYKAEALQGSTKLLWWNPLRLPLTDNSGDGVMADFDPTPDGYWGQIIEFNHEVGPRRVFAPSFGEWLCSLADGLEKGDYIYYEDEETVGPPGIW